MKTYAEMDYFNTMYTVDYMVGNPHRFEKLPEDLLIQYEPKPVVQFYRDYFTDHVYAVLAGIDGISFQANTILCFTLEAFQDRPLVEQLVMDRLTTK